MWGWLWVWSGLWNLVASGDRVHARQREVSYSTGFSELALFHSKAKAKTALTRLEWIEREPAMKVKPTKGQVLIYKCISFHTMFTNTSGWLASKCVIVSSGTLCTFRPSRAKSWWYCDICYRDLWSREAGFRTHVITSLAFQPHPCWVSCLIKFTIWCSKSNFTIL